MRMTTSAPPRPPSPTQAAPESKPLEREEIEALVEALIEEARQETRRRHRKYAAVAALVSFVGLGTLILLDRGAASQPASPALSALSSLPAQAASPKIAYISEPSGGYCGTVYVMNADGSGQRRLANGGTPGCWWEWGHAWSPDGRIAIVSQVPEWTSQGTTFPEIHVFNADGSGERSLVRGISPSWSPDGRRIAFVREGGVHIVNADGSQERRLTPLGAHGLSWSPDGTRILFAHETGHTIGQGNTSEVYVVNADGSGQRRLTRIRRGYFADPAWSPDGRRIVFGHDWQLWVMNADGSGRRQLTLKGAHNFNPAWSPDGRRIAFARGRRQSSSYHVGTPGREVHVMNADGSGQKLLTRGGSQPTWSPGGRIAYVSDRAGSLDIWVMNADGSGQRNLTRGTGRRESQPVWSPALK